MRVATPAGALYAEYTYAPSERILNGFIQALIGLYEYTKLTGDPLGSQLFEAGDAEARAIVPSYDTGAWSMYDQYSESNLNYHELLAEFLQNLCQRTQEGEPTPTPSAPAPDPDAAAAHAGAPPGGGARGAPPPGQLCGCTAACRSRRRSAANVPSADPGRRDLLHHRRSASPPTCTRRRSIKLLTTRCPRARAAGVQLSLSKIANVSLTVRQGGHVVWSNGAPWNAASRGCCGSRPSKAGTYAVS